MKKVVCIMILLLLVSGIAFSARKSGIRIIENGDRYRIIVDKKIVDFNDERRPVISVDPGQHEVVIRTRGGKEIYRKQVNVIEKRTTRIGIPVKWR